MTTTRKVVARKVTTTTKKAAVKKSAPTPPKTVEVKVELTIWVDAGENDPRSIEELREDIREALTDPEGKVRAKRVTNTGGYYIVNGKVCLPDDYDPKTKSFKPGAHPPLWAMSADERAIQQRIEKEKTGPALARNPQGLRTAKETDEHHKQEQRRGRTPAEALHDLHENSVWGKKKKAEVAERDRIAKEEAEELKRLKSASASTKEDDEITDDDFSFEEDEDEEQPWSPEDEDQDDDEEDDEELGPDEASEDEITDDDFEWDEDDVMDDELADEALEEQTSSALAKLRSNGKSIKTVKKPVRKVVRRK